VKQWVLQIHKFDPA